MKFTAAILLLTVSVAILGCGGGGDSHSTPAGQASSPAGHAIPTVRCETAGAGTPARSWRSQSTSIGPVGFFGTGRDFSTASRASGPRPPGFSKETKTPVIVEGHRPVTLSVAPRDRSDARLQAPTSPPWVPYPEIRFIPCIDKARTAWAAGFVLRSQQPITVVVRMAGEPARTLQVGHV